MDDDKLVAFEYEPDEFEKVPGLVGADEQDLRWIRVGLQIGECDEMLGGMLDLRSRDPVLEGRPMHEHMINVSRKVS